MATNNEHWLQRVRYTAAEPTAWLSRAGTLRQAAEDLWRSGNAHSQSPGSELGATVLANWTSPGFVPPETGGSTCDVCFMVFGFALENLAKGIIVCRDPSLVSRARLKSWHGAGHDLVVLFSRAGIATSTEEQQTLERVARIAEWKGRYPVAMNFYDVGIQDPIIGHVAVSNVWPADEFARLCQLYERAKASLVEVMEKIPALPTGYKFE
ncbi:MAG TPA: hypothetical protein VF943_15900 [Burkholderiales bacterium]